MKKKRRNIFSYVILSVWSLIIIGILGWVLMSSFKTNLEIYQTPWAMPAKATLENYHSAWSTMKMSSYFHEQCSYRVCIYFRLYGYLSTDKFCIDTI